MISRPLPYLASVFVLAAVYFAAAKLGLSLAFVAEQVTVVWPPSGIALAALLVFGYRRWPAIFLGAFLANATAHEPLTVACGIAAGNTLEALVGAWLLQRLVGFRNSLERLKDVLCLIIVAAGLSTAVSATIGVASLCLGRLQPWDAYLPLWWTWWLGDAMGDLVMAPVLLTWAVCRRIQWQPRQAAEVAALLLGLIVVSTAVFTGGGPRPAPGYPLEYIVFPFVIWAALRFGQRGSATVNLVALAVAIVGTVNGSGPFAAGEVHWSLVQLHVYMAVVAITGLLLGAVTTERRMAERRRTVGYAITAVLAESPSLADVSPRLLRVICESLNWDTGAIWYVDNQTQALHCIDVWHRPFIRVDEFEASSRKHLFASGTGLPGRVWSSRQAVWIADVTRDDNFPRAPVAARAGLHGAFGFPILSGTKVLGALEFFSRHIEQPDGDLLKMLASIGGQLGVFIERKQAEAALRDSEERVRLMVESVKDYAIFSLDPDGRVATWNTGAERMFGYAEVEILGQSGTLLWNVEDRHAGVPERELALAGVTGRAEDERWHLRKDGSRFFVSGVVTPIRDGDSSLRGFTKVARDITERKRAEESLQEANQRKDEFLAMLAHELRNPLAPIRNSAHVIRMVAHDDPKLRWATDVVNRQVQHLSRLVDDLLDVSRITSGKIKLQKEPVELAAIVARALETSQPLIDARKHTLTVQLPPEPVHLDADATRLAQVFANLLDNASKYTDEGGRVFLTAEQRGDRVAVRVRDTGMGIPPEMLAKVFDLFTQVDRSLARSQGGLGIGLTLVRKLVEMHGGTVEALSAGSGLGSEFIVRLPVLAVGRKAREPNGEESIPGTRQRRVLIVDDNVDSAESLAVLLRLAGHDVRSVYDGKAALEMAANYGPEIVLLDIGLPGMDGYKVARRIREHPELKGVLLVALTGYGQEEDRRRSREAGFDCHMTKPIDPAQLQQLVGRMSVGA